MTLPATTKLAITVRSQIPIARGLGSSARFRRRRRRGGLAGPVGGRRPHGRHAENAAASLGGAWSPPPS